MASFKEQLLEKYSGGSTAGATDSTSFKKQLLEKYTPTVQKPVTTQQQLDNAVQQTLSQNRSAAQDAGNALTNIRGNSPAYAAGQRTTPTLMQKATGGIYDNPSRKAAHQDSVKAMPEKQSIGKTVFDVVDRGAGYFNQGVASTADFVANLLPRAEGAIFGVEPESTFTGQVLKPVTDATGKLKDYVDSTVQAIDTRIQNDTGNSKAAQVAADIGSGTVAALPNAILALMSGGASAAGTLAPQATGAAATAGAAVKKLVSNPMFQTSAIQTLGSSYDDAKADGATDEQAIVAAVLSTAFNSAVEIGGVESLPGQLDNVDLSTGQKALKWAASMLDEGKEEVIQDVISGLTEKAVFDEDRALFSKSIHASEDEGAVISPGRMAQEFGMGAAIGGILGGGQLLSDILPNRNATTPTQTQADNAIQETLRQNNTTPQESQIYNWGIKKDATLGGGGRGQSRIPNDASSVASNSASSILKNPENVNGVGDMGSKPAMGAADIGFDPYSHASNTYGAIEPGENPARVVDVPKSMDGETNVKQTVRTILEADVTTDEAVPAIEQEIVKGGFSAMPITDQAAADRAEATIRQIGYQQALADWKAEVHDGKVNKYSVAMGETLYNAAVSAGDTKSAVKIAVEFATQVRSAAQALQAVRMLKKMSPAAQLYGVKQSVDNLQQQLQKQYGERAPDLKIDETLAANFLNAQTDAERTTAEEALYKDIARQVPATFSDKWNAWRYLSMLGNPRTHIRNIIGNAAFAPVRGVKNQIGGLMEAISQGVGIMDKSQRTKSAGFNWSKKRRALVQAAKADYANVEGQIQSGDKYNSATDIIEKNRRIFNNAVLETLRRGNSTALDVEDTWFSKGAYASSLAGYLNARGYTAEDFTGSGMTNKQKDEARAYAILEAQKATYRDLNALSELVTSAKFKNPANSKTKGGELAKRAANTVVEGVMPFKKTPANILARAMEYSPAGLAKALTVDSVQVAKGNISAAEYMDHLASGLTGTGLFALGYFLSNSGLLVGGSPEDEDQFDLEGRQPYSLEIGGNSITLDWLAPEALPVFMGVELAEAITEYGGEALSMETMKSVFHGITGPVLEMSMMSGLQDALDAVSYADDKMSAIVANAALGYLGQAVPTLFGQIERIIGKGADTRQTTFTQKGQFLDTDTQYALGSTLNKVPLLDFQQIPYIDAWGRTESTGTIGARAANNLVNPAYISEITETPVDTEIKRLEESTGENLTPARAEKVLTVYGEKVLLTAGEYVTYATAKGQNDYTFRENLIGREDYAALDDMTKAKAMDYAKDYADALAKEETGLNADMAAWMAELDGADIDTVTQRFVEKAVESMASNKKLYEDKYDGISGLLDSGTINDEIAIAIMPDDAVDGYMEYCKSAGVTAKQYVDAYAYKNTLSGDTTKTDFLDYLSKQSLNPAQKVAIAQSQYKELPSQWLLDNKASDDVIYESLTEEKKAKYDAMISSNSGLNMQDFMNVAAYRESLSTKVLDNGEKYSIQNQMIDYLDKTYGNDNQKKIAAFLTVYDSQKNIPDWWK